MKAPIPDGNGRFFYGCMFYGFYLLRTSSWK